MAGPSTNWPIGPHKTLNRERQPPPDVEKVLRQYLTSEEEAQVRRQFQQACPRRRQVLWSGMDQSQAQRWADDHHMQTLTTAMGPLMNPKHPQCLQHRKTKKAWSKYVHGASAAFAWYISGCDVVTVLLHPPPVRFNPFGATFYQTIEEPIITGKTGGCNVRRIEVVHPAVPEAADFAYQMWPVDEAEVWKERFGRLSVANTRWRQIKASQVSHNNTVPGGALPGCKTPLATKNCGDSKPLKDTSRVLDDTKGKKERKKKCIKVKEQEGNERTGRKKARTKTCAVETNLRKLPRPGKTGTFKSPSMKVEDQAKVKLSEGGSPRLKKRTKGNLVPQSQI
ncbi:conserved hypothetical protein [Verticillium alfalfae VaMs.102]|uniref:Uncharacterized protein n=1 Tax=Verticillium alfalfae (strain VaMs.102 / ATCC MYA-4576 / FGSC 10136) TaxID=526221 RepID=C9SZ05_VERA1|nr:conserved hypothetical protein [Verticillium alfalfae VaMs.102]EEY24020.1 conserved hypothetical protein [Verticillium alfalfae VaMs.102]KAH6699501.1 hypothetical protein EV126DRAFT_424000 [Verticillium dahliae]